jgi:Ca2+-binding RTX toxin-like protein
MSFTTAAGRSISNQQIRAYFASNPSAEQIAGQAAAMGLTADQIANAVSIGWSASVTAGAVRDWVASHSTTYGWGADGELVMLHTGTLDIDAAMADPGATTETLVLSPTAYDTLNITGDVALDLSPNWEVSLLSVKNVNASTFDAGLHIYMYGNTNDLSVDVGGGNDIVVAGFGNDTLSTGAGDDILFAGRGDDTVSLGAGKDWVRGGPGRDMMSGGTGSDTFAYVFVYESQGAAVDVITDFQAGVGGDILDFSELTHGVVPEVVFNASTGMLYLDIDGNGTMDGVNDMAIQLAGVNGGLVPDNFVF